MPYIGQPPVSGDTTKSFRLLDNLASFTLTFDATSSSVVDTTANTLTFANHRFVTAQRVTYTDGGGTAIGGLTDGTAYFVIKVDQNTIQLASSASNANNGTAISLSAGAAGGSHTLNIAFDGTNTKFKVTYGNGTKARISRAGQLLISINGVLQQAQESSTPTLGFGLDSDSTIVFSQAPVSTDVLFGQILADTITNFDTQDNTLDVFTGDGNAVNFNLSKKPASNNDILVTLDGVVQYPTTTSTSNAYSVTESTLTFTSAPANGVAIQVRHIGFAGATSSAVTGLYGRTGNVTLSSSDDDITVGNVTAGIITATSYGSISGTTASFSGNVSIGGTLTYEDVTNIDSVGLITARSGISITSGDLTLPDSIIHAGDTNTKIRFPAADTFTVETGGSERLRVTSGGLVGIGTDNPAYELDVLGSGVVANIKSTNNNYALQFAGNNCAYDVYLGSDSANNFLFANENNDGTFSERLRVDSSGRLLLGTTTEGHADADDLTIATSGDCGITLRAGSSSSSRLYFSDGTSGADEYRGIITYAHSSDSMRFWTNATEKMRITSDGKFGFNTTNPGAFDSGANHFVILGNTSGTGNAGITLSSGSDSYGNIYFADGTSGADAYRGHIAYNHDGNTMRFATDGSERLRIDSSGKVGINQTSPSAPLSFNTGTGQKIELYNSGSDNEFGFGIEASELRISSGSGSFIGFRTGGYAGTERLRITSDGKVGIGIAAPLQLLHIKGTNPVINIHSDTATGYAGVQFNRAANDTLFGIYAYDGSHASEANNVQLYNYQGNVEVYAGNAKRMRLGSNGQINFTNTSTYAESTSVDTYFSCNTTRDYGLYIAKNGNGNYGIYSYVNGSTSKTQYAIGGQVETTSSYSSGGGLFYSINSNTYGIVGYWSTSAYYTIYGNGVSLCTGGHTTSDARLKDVQSNIGTGILDKVCSLEAKKYTWKENTQQRRSVGDGIQIGLLAQDVQEYFPEVVMEHENPEIAGHNPETLNEQIGTTYSIDYGKLTAVLIEAIKDLKAENNSLAARVAALEG